MNKLVEAFSNLIDAVKLYDAESGAYEPLSSWAAFKQAKKALKEHRPEPSVQAPKLWVDEEGREWKLLDFGYGTASDLRLHLRLGAGLFDTKTVEIKQSAEPSADVVERVARAIFESRYPFSWDIASKRVLNENLYAEASQCRIDAKAAITKFLELRK